MKKWWNREDEAAFRRGQAMDALRRNEHFASLLEELERRYMQDIREAESGFPLEMARAKLLMLGDVVAEVVAMAEQAQLLQRNPGPDETRAPLEHPVVYPERGIYL